MKKRHSKKNTYKIKQVLLAKENSEPYYFYIFYLSEPQVNELKGKLDVLARSSSNEQNKILKLVHEMNIRTQKLKGITEIRNHGGAKFILKKLLFFLQCIPLSHWVLLFQYH